MLIYIGLDDTDNLESRGTGHLARTIASELAGDYHLLGVTRHQLLVDPRVPYTSHNSSAAINIKTDDTADIPAIFERVKKMMLADYQTGSDPGLCIATDQEACELTEFGRRAQVEVVSQKEAHELARRYGICLEGLGGSRDGVIGALSAVGLAACGEDGRYVLVGRSRDISGKQPIQAILNVGIEEVRTLQEESVNEGYVLTDKLRPARRGYRPILYVEKQEDFWQPIKLD
jgi:tRNA(Ile2) C34 agmatinyltransferase TiaS